MFWPIRTRYNRLGYGEYLIHAKQFVQPYGAQSMTPRETLLRECCPGLRACFLMRSTAVTSLRTLAGHLSAITSHAFECCSEMYRVTAVVKMVIDLGSAGHFQVLTLIELARRSISTKDKLLVSVEGNSSKAKCQTCQGSVGSLVGLLFTMFSRSNDVVVR